MSVSTKCSTKQNSRPTCRIAFGLHSMHAPMGVTGDIEMRKFKYSSLMVSVLLVGSCTLLLAKDVPADLEGVELYDWLGFEGIYDPTLNNDTVIDVLEKGLFSDDSDVVAAALNAMNWYASWVGWGGRSPVEPRPFDRELQRISGLKAFLVETWQTEFAESPDFHSNQGLDMMEIRNGRAVFKSESVWQLIPNILAVLYPKDPEATRSYGNQRIPMALKVCYFFST